MFNRSIEDQLNEQEKRLNELEIRDASIDASHEQNIHKMGWTPEELYCHSTDQQNFSEEEWVILEEMRAKLAAELKRDLNNIRNKRHTAKTRTEQSQIQPSWLFVR